MVSCPSMARLTSLAAATFALCMSCAAVVDDGDPDSDGGLGSATLAPGGMARVTATSLNLRNGIGTTATVEASMPCGTQVAVLDGPSTAPVAGWWNVRWDGAATGSVTGWASGTYLVADAAFTAE